VEHVIQRYSIRQKEEKVSGCYFQWIQSARISSRQRDPLVLHELHIGKEFHSPLLQEMSCLLGNFHMDASPAGATGITGINAPKNP